MKPKHCSATLNAGRTVMALQAEWLTAQPKAGDSVTARTLQAIVELDRDAIDPVNAGGVVHNASALHTTPPAHQKPAKQHFDLYYK